MTALSNLSEKISPIAEYSYTRQICRPTITEKWRLEIDLRVLNRLFKNDEKVGR